MFIRRKGLLTNAVNGAALFAVLAAVTWLGLATRARAVVPANSSSVLATQPAIAAPSEVLSNQASAAIDPEALVAKAPVAEADDEDKGIWLNLRASGFEIKEMSIAAGKYFVVIQNASGLDQFALRIERETGERLHDVRLPPLKKRWRQMIHFTPGNYIVSEADHPEWTCRVTVTPPQ